MDASSINTLTGTGEKKQRKDAPTTGDGEAFKTAIGEAGGSQESKKADLIDKDTKDVKDKPKDHPEDKAGVAKKDGGRVSDYVKNLQTRDPATLSMLEKSAYRMGEFSTNKAAGPAGLGQALVQMLASQGISVSGMSPEQIKGLMSRMDANDLGKLLAGARGDGMGQGQLAKDEKLLKELNEKLAQASRNTPVEQQAFNLDQLVSAGLSKEAGDTARAEQRRQVLDQILAQIDVKNVANQTEMNLRLNPEYLGEVKISLVHDDEGGVRANFLTTSKATREVLAENTSDLIGKARDKGVRIGSMSVKLVDNIET